MSARLEAWTSPPPAIRPSTPPRTPRLNPTNMLERHRGKRLVFDCWFNQHGHVGFTCLHHEEFCQRREESVCALLVLVSGHVLYSFLFQDYNRIVEFFCSLFLVYEGKVFVSLSDMERASKLLGLTKSTAHPRYKNAITLSSILGIGGHH